MIAEYERAQIAERTRRGKLHRARGGSQSVLSGAPYGYRYIRKSDIAEAYWEINEREATVVRVFSRVTPSTQTRSRTSSAGCPRTMCRPAPANRYGTPRRSGECCATPPIKARPRSARQKAAAITAPSDAPPERAVNATAAGSHAKTSPPRSGHSSPFPRSSAKRPSAAQARLQENKRFARRNTKQITLLQGILVCRECGYACYRTSPTKNNIPYYRCIGRDNWRHTGGRVCTSQPIRADELDNLVWEQVRRLLENPKLVQAEIDRRLTTLRTEHPATKRRDALERDHTRAEAAVARLIEAYQEQLITLKELRTRTPNCANAKAPCAPSSTHWTPNCTTPRPTSSSPRPSKASSPA